MKSALRRTLLVVLGLVALLVLVAALLLPRLVDAESYRGLLQSNLERQLGREVAFGVMELSLWPVLGLRLDDLVIGGTPAERFDKPVVAESLRVGARLFPLLRGRLEVTSLVVEGPVLTLYRRADGAWEPKLTAAEGDSRTTTAGAGPDRTTAPAHAPLIIERVRVRGARVVLRWDDEGRLRETTLDDLTLRLEGLGTRPSVFFDVSMGAGPTGRFRGNGTLQPADDARGQSAQLSARVDVEDMAPSTLGDWLAALAPTVTLPEELLTDRPFSSGATIDYTGSPPARVEISDAVVRGLGLRLVRAASGVWNIESLSQSKGAEAAAGPEEMSVHLSSLTLDEAFLRIEDRAARGNPATLELAPVRVEVRQPRLDAPMEIDFDATGGVEARAALKGRLRYDPPKDATPGRLRGTLEATSIDPRDLGLATTLASLPPGLVVGRRFGVSAELDASLGETADVTLRDVTLRDLDVSLVREASGAWSFAGQPAGRPGPTLPTTSAPLRVERIGLTNASLRMTDRATPGEPAVLNLSALRLSLDRLPTAGPATLELAAQVGPGEDGKLTASGKLGPLAADPAATPLDLALKLGPIAPQAVPYLLPALGNLDASQATAAANLRLSGTFAQALEIGGDVSLSQATVTLASPHGQVRRLPFDLRARGNLTLRNSASRIELSKLELELPRGDANRTLTLRGFVNAATDPPKLDIELLPTSVAADDLAALAALLAPDAPLTFSSPDPVALELRARGSLGGATLPDLEGRATLSKFSFRVAGMTAPMENVGAKVVFSPDQVTLDGLRGTIGKSDVTSSRVVVTNFEAPRVQLDLDSGNADFWELFSFVESDEVPTNAQTSVGNAALSQVTIGGTLRIERGSLATLVFEKLTTGMDFRSGVLTLEPLSMNVHGGSFAGKIVQDLNTGVLEIIGNGTGVDADGFLAQNLDLGGLISGRASTELRVQVRAIDPANLLAGVSGGGPLQLVDGRVAKLDVLRSLSKVTGIFGERSLQRLTKQLASVGTPFQRAETRLSFDSGTVTFEDLVVETTELTLAGRASLESATGNLDGRFAVAFSSELSATMREEQSRAANLLWDAKAQRVSFGFGMRGPATSPKVSVDWDTALRGVAERKLGDRLRGLLERKLGVGTPPPTSPPGGETTPAPAGTPAPPAANEPTGETTPGSPPGSPPDPVPSAVDATETPAAPVESSPSTDGLVAEITRTRWTGPVLLRDLSLEGNVRGAGIERAALIVVDARGTEVKKIDRLGPVDDQLAAVADRDAAATFSWSAQIDGKRLLAARFPVKVTVTVYDRQGRRASATREVER